MYKVTICACSEESEIVFHSEDTIAQVGYLKLGKLRLGTKLPTLDLQNRLAGLPLKDSESYVADLLKETDKENVEGIYIYHFQFRYG